MMTISEDFLFRLEKFGGILINKVTFDRIELDESEAYFLYLVQNHGFEIAILIIILRDHRKILTRLFKMRESM